MIASPDSAITSWPNWAESRCARRTVGGGASDQEFVDAIADAQRRGTVSDRFSAGQTLALILTRANMWQQQNEDFHDLVPAETRRATIVDAVNRLITPGS